MDCTNKTIKELLPLYEEGKLGEEELALVEEHIRICEDCRDEMALLRMMTSEPVPDPGDAFWAAMPERIYREVQQQRSPAGITLGQALEGFLKLLLQRRVWAAASAFAVVLLVSWLVVGPLRQQQAVPPIPGDEYAYDDTTGQDAALAAPALDVAELTPAELEAAATWAGKELSAMAIEAETTQGTMSENDLYEELSELNSRELDRLSMMLQEFKKEG